MAGQSIRIATRGSDLALWQANWVGQRIRLSTAADVELVRVASQGDRDLHRPLQEIEGMGFFTREIELAVLDGRADVAVHSYKDLPTDETPGLVVAAVPERGPPNDWLLIRPDSGDREVPVWPIRRGAVVGTCSLRRSAQLRYLRPDLDVANLRGNVPTRVERLRAGDFDAVVLAQAGLVRLGLDLSDLEVIDLLPSGFLPAAGQGALAVQCASRASEMRALLSLLNHPPSAAAVSAERALSALFEGGCSLALGCLATATGSSVELRAAWPQSPDNFRRCIVSADDPEQAARMAFERLTQP